jgi:hypothetical protein
MGWRIHRVWSTEWFHDRERTIDGILKSVEQALKLPATRPVYAPPAEEDPAASMSVPSCEGLTPENPRRYKPGIPYSVCQPARRLDRDHLLDPSNTAILSDTIAELIRTEGPIHRERLIERLKDLHNIARVGPNVQANIDRALRSAERSGSIAHDPGSPFYSSPSQQVDSFRLPGDSMRRAIEHIAPAEISMAVLYLVEDQFGVIEDALPQAVARLFGIERLRGESADIIRGVVEDLLSRGMLRRAGTQVHLA